jgi:hypothetical protein
LSRAEDFALPAMPARTAAMAKKIMPPTATGTPMKLPYWLRYACVQLTFAVTSQKLL